jgi:hypothetical protein
MGSCLRSASTRWTACAGKLRLDAAASRILAAGGAGNASIVVDLSRADLRIYWHGRVPAKIQSYARGLGVHVMFKSAAFTLRALAAEERRLAGYPGVVGVAPRPDGSGLNVTVNASA